MQDRITTTQVTLLVTNNILGVTYLIMPRIVAEYAGRDGWMSILLAGLGVLFFNVLFVMLGSRFPGKTLIKYAPLLVGKFLGAGINMFFIFFLTLLAAMSLRNFGDVTKVFLLNRTPLEVIMISMLFVVGYLLNHGLNAVARMVQVLFPLILGALTLILVLGQPLVDYGELLPLFRAGPLPILMGALRSWGLFSGFGLMLMLLPQMFQPEQGLKASSVGIILPLLFYLGAFVIVLGVFGEVDVTHLIYPVMDLTREAEFPGAFVERLDILILTIWIFTSFTTVAISSYVSIWAAGQSLGLKEHRGLVVLWLPLLYLLALLPQNNTQVVTMRQVLSYASIIISLIMALLVVLAKFVGSGKGDSV